MPFGLFIYTPQTNLITRTNKHQLIGITYRTARMTHHLQPYVQNPIFFNIEASQKPSHVRITMSSLFYLFFKPDFLYILDFNWQLLNKMTIFGRYFIITKSSILLIELTGIRIKLRTPNTAALSLNFVRFQFKR